MNSTSFRFQQRFDAALAGIRWRGHKGIGRCPFHNDHRPSLSIDAQKGLFFCHGCRAKGNLAQFETRITALRGSRAKGLITQMKHENRDEKQSKPEIEAQYTYCDEEGEPLSQQVRYKGKGFAFRSLSQDGKWQWGMKGARRVLYKLPEVIAANEVFVVEGEKDVETLRAWGLVATCNPGGAGKWTEEYSKFLKGKKVGILQDDDVPGRKHAKAVAASVAPYASEVRFVPPFPNAKDVTEWVEQGGTKKKLREIVDATAPIEQDDTASDSPEEQSLQLGDWRREPLRGSWIVSLPEQLFLDYLILPAGIAFVVSLWTVATYVFEDFDCFPYLLITSPTKRCGKTRCGEILELLCCRSIMSTNFSEAALFRSIDSEKPTVIIDEAEALRSRDSERSRYLLPILQSGFGQGGSVRRCVGKEHEVEKFSVFCPKAILSIGALPDTLTDRSIVVSMRRHLPDEHIERFRRRYAKREADGTVSAIEAWTDAHKEQISKAYLRQNLDFLRDREADIWEPLFAVASVAVSQRLDELKQIAIRLSAQKASMDVDDSQGLRLLADIRAVFYGTNRKSLPSAELVDRLKKDISSHWDEELTQTKLARLLRPFGISPQQIWLDERNFRGYRREDFTSAFARYLPPENR